MTTYHGIETTQGSNVTVTSNNQEYMLEVAETSRLWVDMYDVIGFKP
jgi:hypothetical protein